MLMSFRNIMPAYVFRVLSLVLSNLKWINRWQLRRLTFTWCLSCSSCCCANCWRCCWKCCSRISCCSWCCFFSCNTPHRLSETAPPAPPAPPALCSRNGTARTSPRNKLKRFLFLDENLSVKLELTTSKWVETQTKTRHRVIVYLSGLMKLSRK